MPVYKVVGQTERGLTCRGEIFFYISMTVATKTRFSSISSRQRTIKYEVMTNSPIKNSAVPGILKDAKFSGNARRRRACNARASSSALSGRTCSRGLGFHAF
jgi:hypothetical protein